MNLANGTSVTGGSSVRTSNAWPPLPRAVANVNDELDETMHRILLELPQRQRAAIVLRFYEDLTDVQTAAVLGCSPGTVRSLVSRGMQTLREEMEGVPR